jgi:DNA polymerase III epsilon subunit-like protein
MTEKFIVLDTETTNSIDDPIVYDLGWAVVDKNGNIYQTYSFVVADVFLDSELMASAYFADKIPTYWEQIKSGERTLAKFSTIRKIFQDCAKAYNVTKFFAHNMRFDYRSVNLTQRFLTSSKYRYFFPYGAEICDTLKMARQALKGSEEYDNFCYSNNYLTKRGCKRYTAEIIYKFITGKLDFEESHTGLEDVLIEKEILKYCLKHNPEFSGKLW